MKIHVIVNPNAGRRVVQHNLEQIIGKLILDGTAEAVTVTRTEILQTTTEVHIHRIAAAVTRTDTIRIHLTAMKRFER